MERRKILLGSGTVLATVLAGCGSNTDTSGESPSTGGNGEGGGKKDENKEKSDSDTGNKSDEKPDDKPDDTDDGKKKKTPIPGFDREAFKFESEIIEIKELTYRKRKLEVRVMIKTDDQDELIEELRELAPALRRAITDATEFLTAIEEVTFSLYDEHKNRVVGFFVDVAWLREFLRGTMSEDELIERARGTMSAA